MKRHFPSPVEIESLTKAFFTHCTQAIGPSVLKYLIPVNRAFLPGKGALPFYLDREMNELCSFVTDYDTLTTPPETAPSSANADRCMRIHSRALLLLYCHIMEADYPYITLLNLALGALGYPPCWTFYKYRPDGSIDQNKHQQSIILRHPGDRIECLKVLTAALQKNIVSALNSLWSSDLRNGFSHSQYFIEPDGSVILSQHHTGVSGTTSAHALKQNPYFPHEDLLEMYLSARRYLYAFVTQYRALVDPYKDGAHYDIGLSAAVTWNRDQQCWDYVAKP